ncbi:hypothetical protein [Paraliobacillus sediminis]|uniref:hypothetical protein n=1 Tax=Paraliobacillus sediminis TaxID=1885916 RepID=UPI0013C35FE4|nr:hypothetical protein [Paraliobacillus sediminis]
MAKINEQRRSKDRKYYGSMESYKNDNPEKIQKPIKRSHYVQQLWEKGAGWNE